MFCTSFTTNRKKDEQDFKKKSIPNSTIFFYYKSNSKTKSVENRLVTFPTSTRHATAINNCDALYRCVVNINWFRHEN